MRTRDKSKAQLLRELQAAHTKNEKLITLRDQMAKDLESCRDQLQACDKAIKQLQEENRRMHVTTSNAMGQEKLLNNQLLDMTLERDDWKKSFLEMQARMKQMRKNFFQQAALAGELADNAFATVGPVNATDNEC